MAHVWSMLSLFLFFFARKVISWQWHMYNRCIALFFHISLLSSLRWFDCDDDRIFKEKFNPFGPLLTGIFFFLGLQRSMPIVDVRMVRARCALWCLPSSSSTYGQERLWNSLWWSSVGTNITSIARLPPSSSSLTAGSSSSLMEYQDQETRCEKVEAARNWKAKVCTDK